MPGPLAVRSHLILTPLSIASTDADRFAAVLPQVRMLILEHDLSEIWHVDHGETYDLAGEAVYVDEFLWGPGATGAPMMRALKKRWRS